MTSEGFDMTVRNASRGTDSSVGVTDHAPRKGMLFPFQPLSLAFNHINYYVDMPTPSLSTPFQSVQPAQTIGSFGFGNFGQTQAAGTSGFGGMPSIFGQSTFGQSSVTQGSAVAQPLPVANPFGTLPAMPHMSIGHSGTAPSIQYGISSLPVVDKHALVRISSLLTSRHLSQRRIRLPARKYHPKNDGPKVPLFTDDEETPSTPKALFSFRGRILELLLFVPCNIGLQEQMWINHLH